MNGCGYGYILHSRIEQRITIGLAQHRDIPSVNQLRIRIYGTRMDHQPGKLGRYSFPYPPALLILMIDFLRHWFVRKFVISLIHQYAGNICDTVSEFAALVDARACMCVCAGGGLLTLWIMILLYFDIVG